MRIRESGMPEEEVWGQFFRPVEVLMQLRLSGIEGDVVEFGCGYGTFTVPAARLITGNVIAFDIDETMIVATEGKSRQQGVRNVQCVLRDFVANGTGLPPDSAAYVMLFNLLHAESPLALLSEAWRVLSPGGLLGVIHWQYDVRTPRGPNLSIRPRPEQCAGWAREAGFKLVPPGTILLPPYHYGFVARK